MKKFIYIDWHRLFTSRWRFGICFGVVIVVAVVTFWLNGIPFRTGFEIVDDLGGNVFPSSILSVATTDAQVIVPSDSMYVGNPKSCIAVRLRSGRSYTRVRIEVAETPFFSRSVSEFVLPPVLLPFGVRICVAPSAYRVHYLS